MTYQWVDYDPSFVSQRYDRLARGGRTERTHLRRRPFRRHALEGAEAARSSSLDQHKPKAPSEKTLAELAADMHTRAEGLTHLMARAEMELRRTEAQLRATTYMLVASIAAAVSAASAAIAAASAAYVAFLGGR